MAHPYDEVAIYQFPHEIFHCIFGFLVSEDFYQLQTGTSKRPIVSFTISQVSQRWRDRPSLPIDAPPMPTRLRDFSLAGIVLRDLSSRSYLSEYTALLTTLSLSNMSGYRPADVTRLFIHLPTTTLRELSISHVDIAFWVGFIDSMAGADSRYPVIRKLHLQDIEENFRIQETDLPSMEFIRGFPKLEIIELCNIRHITHAIFPCVHTLKVSGVQSGTYKDLCDVVDFRIEHAIPLTTLEVDTPPFLDVSSLSWLQKKVPNFKRNAADKISS
ncbi:hypothetical protein J3R30DRAFT_3715543 [Lentinula aciculospora]|uniref:Uncharacterized protein n=1 Tax=Lentinula aciculospora TaxID=153920 RepID=A0A9W9DG44_9AGAR|nr:hypothetical protein J3R30DRAFT_3715543 [Lentinula aciculospora]